MYQISVEVPGFKKYVSSGIVVQVDDKLAINIKLDIGSPTETITVSGEAPPMRTEDAETGEVVNNDFIMNLPEIDRNPFDLIRISGNVQGSEGGVSSNTRINGGRTSSIDFYIDGDVVTSGVATRSRTRRLRWTRFRSSRSLPAESRPSTAGSPAATWN